MKYKLSQNKILRKMSIARKEIAIFFYSVAEKKEQEFRETKLQDVNIYLQDVNSELYLELKSQLTF